MVWWSGAQSSPWCAGHFVAAVGFCRPATSHKTGCLQQGPDSRLMCAAKDTLQSKEQPMAAGNHQRAFARPSAFRTAIPLLLAWWCFAQQEHAAATSRHLRMFRCPCYAVRPRKFPRRGSGEPMLAATKPNVPRETHPSYSLHELQDHFMLKALQAASLRRSEPKPMPATSPIPATGPSPRPSPAPPPTPPSP